MTRRLSILASLLLATAFSPAHAATYGPELQGFSYPHPVRHYKFASQGQQLQMAYMDVAPTAKANGKTAVLMHGKSFCGATRDSQITALRGAGCRVIAPDQIGFAPPANRPLPIHLQQLAANTAGLLKQAGVERAVLVAHSTGGMLATRHALMYMYPQAVSQLVMVNPIGLEDWKALGVPCRRWINGTSAHSN
ncbi:alpha/beta fold hydrolase [Janthinobacterium psychrotolerans]|uniref:Alpha/beta hydrolase family protein n=1 Tax=Janthinobacterium psychrotolerans TaxID=1747903 RepID=A0A1A7BZH9_9BURK|nr:Alpha/beta hydrolase family protein [Janthinobacterium psychrotolerans]